MVGQIMHENARYSKTRTVQKHMGRRVSDYDKSSKNEILCGKPYALVRRYKKKICTK